MGSSEFRVIPGKGMWALVHADDLSQGINTNYFGAMFVKCSLAGKTQVSFQDIDTFQDVDDELCAERGGGPSVFPESGNGNGPARRSF